MAKKNRNKLFITLAIIWVLGAILVGLIMVGTTKSTSYFYDEDLGVIKYEVTIREGVATWFGGLFQQALTFADTNIEVDDTVQLDEAYTIPPLVPNTYVTQFTFQIRRGSELISSFNGIMSPVGETAITTDGFWSFTPDEPGVYSAYTIYQVQECSNPPILDVAAQCDPYPVDTLNSPGTNTVTVTEPVPTECDEQSGWTNWESHGPTSDEHGEITKRRFITIGDAPDCDETEGDWEYITTCDNGYYITGTTSSVANDIKTCELADTGGDDDCIDDPSLCTAPQVCDQTTALCVDPSCSDGDILEVTCPDGVNVTTKECDGGVMVDKFNCDNHQINDTNQTGGTNQTGNGTGSGNDEILCWGITNSTGNMTCSSTTTTGTCGSDTFATKVICEDAIEGESNLYMIIAIVGGSLLLIGIIVFFIVRKKK